MTTHQPIKPVLYPDAQKFLDDLAAQGGPPIYTLPVKDARGVLTGAQAGKVDKPSADVEDRKLPVGPSGSVSVRIIRPKGASGALPALMYFHGGGWVLGDMSTHDRLVHELAAGANITVVSVDYTRSPEARYPVALEECFAVTKWVAENGKQIGVDGSRLAVAGDSAGGTLAAAVTILAKERGGPKLRVQVLFYPVTNAAFDTSSYEQFAEGYFLTREAMKWFWDQYAPDAKSRQEITASPLKATPEQLKGLPPALIMTAEADVLRDEGEAYARKLIEAGVPVSATRHIGIIHDFVMLNVVTKTPAARDAIAQAVAVLQKALS